MTYPKSREELHELLCEILGSRNCYYSPPTSIRMEYPCIVYHLSGTNNDHADNMKYKKERVYTLTLIDEDPDSEFSEKIETIPYCSFDRSFTSDDLNHFVFTLYI